jgi:transcriptional pleiotropic regulator of transition state genes
MKSTGMVRKVDELGRIVLPIEIRKTMHISNRDALEIYVEEDKVILKKYEPACIFCGSADDVTYYKGKLICQECLQSLKTSVLR